ncbi:MAG: hypothetical protein ABIM88_03270 [candidate division WOR-3 bacterium]
MRGGHRSSLTVIMSQTPDTRPVSGLALIQVVYFSDGFTHEFKLMELYPDKGEARVLKTQK